MGVREENDPETIVRGFDENSKGVNNTTQHESVKREEEEEEEEE